MDNYIEKIEHLKKKREIAKNRDDKQRASWQIFNEQENVFRRSDSEEQKLKYALEILDTLEEIYIIYDEREDYDHCDDVLALVGSFRKFVVKAACAQSDVLKKILELSLSDIDSRCEIYDKIEFLGIAISALERIVEKEPREENKALLGELLARKAKVHVDNSETEEAEKSVEAMLEILREIDVKGEEVFVNPTKQSDLDLKGFADSGIDFVEIVEVFQMKCKAKTKNKWGRISYGLFELLDELLDEYEDEISGELEDRIQNMRFKEMKDAVDSGFMPEFGLEYLAHSFEKLLYSGNKSKEEKIELLKLEIKAWEIHLKEFPERGALKLNKAKEQLEDLMR